MRQVGYIENVMALDRLRVRTNIILLFPEFIQLLIGLMLIVNKSLTYYPYCSTSAAALSLYIMTQCQLKLHLSRRSLAETLSYAEVAPRNDEETPYTNSCGALRHQRKD